LSQSAGGLDLPHHLDVLIVGAGISGIGAAHALRRNCPDRTFAVLDAFESFGGTWWSHRYPGVRSDSDLFTYGFRFKPWRGAPIASRAQILSYLGEVIEEYDLERHFRYGCRVLQAEWDSAASLWRIQGVHGPERSAFSFTCGFLWMCQGYYEHAQGYTPEWPGMADFQGAIVHPQTWPEDLVYRGKRVVVIGSGATAVTLLPALAADCEHVTMLQRSPSYVTAGPNRDPLADTLRELGVDAAIIHDIMRKKVAFDQHVMLTRALEDPDAAKAELLSGVAAHLPAEDVEAHFTPAYRPWQQRVTHAPDGDFFKALRSGRASMVTDQIETLTRAGLRLASGRELSADIIVTATGFDLSQLGGVELKRDGRPLNLAETTSYRGIMFTGIPNLARTVGYFRVSSWTLRVELVADFVCRLLNYMRSIGASAVETQIPEDPGGAPEPDHQPGNDPFNASYFMRSRRLMPRSSPRAEWRANDYWWEKDALPAVRFNDEPFTYRDPRGEAIRPARRTARAAGA
jgi:cation diffusion facilitator CzcD-associated flavoprotein CzcO